MTEGSMYCPRVTKAYLDDVQALSGEMVVDVARQQALENILRVRPFICSLLALGFMLGVGLA